MTAIVVRFSVSVTAEFLFKEFKAVYRGIHKEKWAADARRTARPHNSLPTEVIVNKG